MGWPPAVALLVAAALAPTDPALAAEVRVGEPTDDEDNEDEVRLALTTASATGWSTDGPWHWVWSDILVRSTVGLAVGLGVGGLLGWVFFQAALLHGVAATAAANRLDRSAPAGPGERRIDAKGERAG